MRVRNHNERALCELLARYYRRLVEFAFTLLRRRDLADEAVMNVFLNLWRREQLQVKGQVRSYLFAAVGNQSLNLRKQQRRHVAESLDEKLIASLVDRARTDDNLLYQELRAEVEKLIAGLPRQRQLVFRLHRLEGLAYDEIAATLGISKRTVQNHMILAAKQLAPELPGIKKSMTR